MLRIQPQLQQACGSQITVFKQAVILGNPQNRPAQTRNKSSHKPRSSTFMRSDPKNLVQSAALQATIKDFIQPGEPQRDPFLRGISRRQNDAELGNLFLSSSHNTRHTKRLWGDERC